MTKSFRPQETDAWHTLGIAEVFDQLDANVSGLAQSEAEARIAEDGPNLLPQKPPTPLVAIVIRQFRSPLIYILFLAAIVSVVIGDVKDAAFIAGVLILNGVIGAYQEWKAEQSSHALRKLLQIRASVERDGEVREINAEDVVRGDVVWLESGNRVPADLRILSAHGLEVDESLLTGESLPVLKDADWLCPEATPIADRKNMAYAGAIATRGRAKGIVIATGASTNVGQLTLDVLQESGGKPPLLIRMERFTQVIAIAVLLAATGIGILGFYFGGYAASQMFLFAVALAVSAIPEGLPVAMTVALAIATTRMAKRGLIVRRLTAVEGLGSCTLVATDKTGTLTCNELTVREIRTPAGDSLQVTGQGFTPEGQVLRAESPAGSAGENALGWLARTGVLCNEADLHPSDDGWICRGDAVDLALLTLGHKLGWMREATLDRYPQVNQIPFEPEYQFAASFHRADAGQTMLCVKGSPERVLAMCTSASEGDFERERCDAMAIDMAKQGYRVLALADAEIDHCVESDDVPPEPNQLRFLGFVAMIDPLRAGVKEAVARCNDAGVSVSMITGDHRLTALAIAKELGFAEQDSQVMTGAELEDRTATELRELVDRIRVFARVAPRQKLEIVNAAREAGHFVAVTGDGVNDAPALRASNIGVAMGKSGTDVAREAAELVISDDNFATIVAGIEEGRVAYDNIRKVIYLLISTGAAELVLMALAVATGTPFLPLLPVQILWLNLVTNGIQDVALAFEPNEGGVLQRKPRSPRERIFDRLMIERTVVAASVMGVIGFCTFKWYLPENATQEEVNVARNALLLLMVLFENIHIGNCRSETRSALRFSPLRSPILLTGAILAFCIHLLAMSTPIGQSLLDTNLVGWKDWLLLLSLAFVVFPVMEFHKWTWNKRFRSMD